MSDSKHLPTHLFLERAREFVEIANNTQSSLNMTMKRALQHDPVEKNAEYDATNQPLADVSCKSGLAATNQKEYPVLVRLMCRSREQKLKCSSLVRADELDKFWQDYVAVLKGGMTRLVKTKKKKAKTKAKKAVVKK
ncbi:AaceriADR277Cp [[Ashbya] aceris (nom. inval.)]|nr:AaceriADR277Cp [[Ashbya] aceris (nom. inval.)]